MFKDCVKPRGKNVIEIKMEIWHELEDSTQNYRFGGLRKTGSKYIVIYKRKQTMTGRRLSSNF